MVDIKTLNLDEHSNLGDLPKITDCVIDFHKSVHEALQIFKMRPGLLGMIFLNNGEFYGMISRYKTFEILSKPYARELYIQKSLKKFFDTNVFLSPLIMNENTSIIKATQKVLINSDFDVREPIITLSENNIFSLMDVHHLLLAQSEIHFRISKKLEAANEFKSEVIRIAAHDLKNPLNSIIGFSRLVQDFPDDEEIRNEAAKSILNSAERMLDLITNLLNAETIEVGKMTLLKEEFNPTEVINAVLHEIGNHAQKKNQKIVEILNFPHEKNIIADKGKIFEVVENLISNAIKYSPLGKQITIKTEESNSKIRVSIIDEGPGLTENDKKKVFGKFNRLSAQPTMNESSTGLGLYIVKQIIDLHEGNIVVESEFGKGASFIFELPIGK